MNSTSSTGRRGFPPSVLLIDTGERRYPLPGDYYYWVDDDGMSHGPHHAPTKVSAEWVSDPERYAIYQVAESDGKVH